MRARMILTHAIVAIACAAQEPPSDSTAGGSGELSAAHRAALGDSLAALAEQMLARARAMDVEGTVASYSGRPDFTHVDNGVLLEWPDLEAGVRSSFAEMEANDIRWVEPPRILLLDENVAVIVGLHRFGGGGSIAAHDGLWTGVLERIEGTWKIVHSHSSDVREP